MQRKHPEYSPVKSSTKALYLTSVLFIWGLLVLNFFLFYSNTANPDQPREETLRMVYLLLSAAFLLLVGQAVLVYRSMIARLDDDGLEAETLRRRLDELNTVDELTGVHNRTKFESVMVRELGNVKRYGVDITGIMFDVDDLKCINEKHGYKRGDDLLQQMARYVQKRIRKTDYLFRWRGGKFIILAPNIGGKNGGLLAEKLRQVLGHKLWDGEVRMTISFGVTQVEVEDTVDTFLMRLQGMLTKSKNLGKNCVCVCEEENLS